MYPPVSSCDKCNESSAAALPGAPPSLTAPPPQNTAENAVAPVPSSALKKGAPGGRCESLESGEYSKPVAASLGMADTRDRGGGGRVAACGCAS